MSIKTIYTCDKCGKTQSTPSQFWTVAVVAKEGTICSWSMPLPEDRSSMQVCRTCLELLGIYRSPDVKPGSIALPPPPTLEEMIGEICRNHITEMTGAT